MQSIERLPVLGRHVATNDDSTAIAQNPANIALMPGAEFRWSSVYLDEQALVPWQGHALSFAFPVPFLRLGTGLRLDLVNPTAASEPYDGNLQFLTWAFAFGGQSAALGFSLQRTYAQDNAAHGLSSWSAGLTLRPADGFALAGVAHDINEPSNDLGGVVWRSYDVGLALRPLGTRSLELGLEGKYLPRGDGYWVPRATLGVDISALGRVRGEFSMIDPTERIRERSWLASVSLAVLLNTPQGSTELAAGSVFGERLGSEADDRAYANVHTELAFRGFREPVGPEVPVHALRIRIEDTPGTRAHVALLQRLWDVAENEPSVAAVVLELRTAPAQSLARAQELRDAIYMIRNSGKRVLCHLEDAGGSELYTCSAANQILVNPAGGLRFAGFRSRYTYYNQLLQNIRVEADFVRIGDHKSAPEAYTRTEASETARRDAIDLIQQYERHVVHGLSVERRIDVAVLRERIATGPFVASEARKAGLVDGFAFDDQLEEEVGKLVGQQIPLIDDDHARRAPLKFGNGRRIAVVYVDGDMVDGRSVVLPFLGVRLVGSYTVAEALKQVREDPNVAAVVLRVETPGGSAMAADVIWREVKLTAEQKPVVVSMGSFAASGGYYVSSPGTRIFANPLSVTGSIGIFYGKVNLGKLAQTIGVNFQTYKTAPRADAESVFRPFTPEERTELERKVGQFYDMFLERVAEGRGMTKEAVDAVGRGRVWTGHQARQRRLVDELGGLRQALAYARSVSDLPADAPIVELPEEATTILGMLLGTPGVESAQRVLPAELVEVARALAPFMAHPPDKPLARMELVPSVP